MLEKKYDNMYEDIKNRLNFPDDIKNSFMESSCNRIKYYGNAQNEKWGLRAYDIIVQIEPYVDENSHKIVVSLKMMDEPWRDSYGFIDTVIKDLNEHIDRFFMSLSYKRNL